MSEPKIFIYDYGEYNEDPEIHYNTRKAPLAEALEIMTDDWICGDHACWETIIDLRDAVKHLLNRKDQ